MWPRQPSFLTRGGIGVSVPALARVRHNEGCLCSSPYQIVLSAPAAVLAARARSVRGPYRDRLRARIVLRRRGGANAAIAGQLGCMRHGPQVAPPVRRGRLAGLTDAPRSGRPPVVHRRGPGRGHRAGVRAAGRVRGAAVAVEQPGPGPRTGRPLAGRGLGVHDPPVAGRRRAQALAAPVLDLSPRPALRRQGRPRARPVRRDWDGEPLGQDDYVLSADEKTCVQARCRCHPTAAARARPARCASSTSTTAAARWPTWPPGTSTAPRSSAGASPPPASRRSPGWWSR